MEIVAKMDSYLDIYLLPDLEMNAPVLMNFVFAKLHRHLAHESQGRIGVSFPKAKQHLGDVLRLHGTVTALDAFMSTPWLKGLRDYTACRALLPVPESILGYCHVRRVQKKSVANRRKRSVAKGWLTEDEALLRIPQSHEQVLTLPYLQMQSLSTRQMMRIYIDQGKLHTQPEQGVFNAYGLSTCATIPWF